MARSSAVRSDLFITVGGDVTPLKVAMTAGRSVLNEFGSAAIDVQAEVTKAFAGMAANAPAEAKRLEQAYAATFSQIRRNAQSVLSAPNGGSAVNIVNATGATQAAAAAEGEAAALRLVANAAAAADAATLGTNAGTRAYAVAAEAAAQESAAYAAGLRSQAQVLGAVDAALVASGGAQQRFNQGNIAIAGGAGNARIAQFELMHVVRGSMDQLAAGASASQVLAMHMSMLGQAAALAGDSMGKFGRFMGGPYGLLLTVGISVLTMLIGKHSAAKKAAEDHGDAEKTLTAYVNGEKIATDALLQSLIQLNEQRSKALDFTDQAIRKEIDLTKATLDHAQANKLALQTQLAAAKGVLSEAKGRLASGDGPGQAPMAAGQVAAAQANVDALQSASDELDKVIGQATATISDDIVKMARDLSTHVGQATDQFDKLQAQLEAKYRGTATQSVDDKGKVLTTLHGGLLNQSGLTDARRQQLLGQLTQEEMKLTVAREKAVAAARELDKAEQDKTETAKEAAAHFKSSIIGAEGTGPNQLGSSAAGFGQFMPKTWLSYFNRLFPDKAQLSDAAKLGFRNVREVASAVIDKATDDYVAFLKGAGQQITRANLYTVHLLGNPDAKKLLSAAPNTPTSALFSKSVLADNPFLKGTAASARAAIATRIGDSSGAVSSGTAAIDQALKTQAEKELQQQAAFDSDRDRLNGQLLDAIGQVAVNYQEEAASSLRQAQAEHDAEATKIANNLAEGKYGEATSALATTRAQQLQHANDELAAQRTANILIRRYLAQQEDLQKTADQEHGFRIDALRFLADNAKTAGERRALELKIIDAQYEQLKYDLQIAKSKAIEAQNWAEAARIDARLANLPSEQARDQSTAIRNTQGPLDSYLSGLPRTAGQVDKQFQGIEVNGLEHAVDVLAEFRHGWKAARDAAIQALDDIAGQLIKLGLDELVGKIFKVGKATAAGEGAGMAAAGASLNTAGASLNLAGGTLMSSATIWQGVAIQLQAAAAELAAAGAVNGAAGAAGGLASLLGTSSGVASSVGSDFALGLGGFAGGGRISGVGTSTSDSIPLMGSNGEYMIQAAAVRKFGVRFFDTLNDGKVPHLKGGGLLGALSLLSPLAFLATHSKSFNPLMLISPLAGLLAGKNSGGGSIPSSMLSALSPAARLLAANNNQPRDGDTNIYVTAPHTGDPLRDRQTGTQFAAGMESQLARKRAKGTM
jgi:hypothetical protein